MCVDSKGPSNFHMMPSMIVSGPSFSLYHSWESTVI